MQKYERRSGGTGADGTLRSKGLHRSMELLEGKMKETSGSESVSTKLQRIAKLAKDSPSMSITTLAHHIDIDWLREAYRRTRKDGAKGVDGQSAAEYAANLEGNLAELLERAKSGTYRAPPVRRVHIPKGDGKQTRPIGIPTFEDKILQRAVSMALEAVYEQDFHDCSYGFRPGRSPHQALDALWKSVMAMGGGWVLEVDLRKFFDTLDHGHLREILRKRIRDGVLLRLIGKWLKAGVLDDRELVFPKEGTPQGGVISPLLANVYLHEVIDEWFAKDVQPRLKGRASLVRYADDFVMVFALEEDARRVLEVLPKRLERFGLALHPDKTRLLDFRPPDRRSDDDEGGPPSRSFALLGFTHYWARSRKGRWVVKKKTAKDRLSRSLHRIRKWCRNHRHDPVRKQHRDLCRKLRGHYAYYGVTGNIVALSRFRHEVVRAWHKWLSRRSHSTPKTWDWMLRLLKSFPLPAPRIVHRV